MCGITRRSYDCLAAKFLIFSIIQGALREGKLELFLEISYAKVMMIAVRDKSIERTDEILTRELEILVYYCN